MNRLLVAAGLVFLGALFLVALPRPVAAQFDTPNRAFHESTAFRLDGRHATVACSSCHLNGQYQGTPTTCYGCHWVRRKDDRYQTRLGTECEQCHRTVSWSAVRWQHASATGMALNASHRTLNCVSCHRDANFNRGMVLCASCHRKDYDATRSPAHAAAGFSLNCETCHRPADATWRTGAGSDFNHNAVFPLVGVHATVGCVSCHRSNVYKGTGRECVSCHQGDYNATKNPNHAGAGFSTACETCHRPTDPAWRGGGGGTGFNHNAVFQLGGVHATQACASCHRNNVFKGTRRECVGCHQANYNTAQNPNHVAAGFSTQCETCHRATDPQWRTGAPFNHNAIFPLVGMHATQACASCHRNNVFKGTARTCIGCHQNDYNRTQNPGHAAAGFSTQCETCHRATDSQWRGASFNHDAVFRLVGTHAAQACASCHRGGVYGGTSRTCIGCHQSEYNATQRPNHAAAGFSTSCESCHRATDTRWEGVTFNHSAVFPLIGVHASQSCASCHRSNVYRGTARTCVGCHQSDYNATRNPNHAATGFPTTCESCHRGTDTSWTQGRFSHTWFPLSGPHNKPCAQCHTTPNAYSQFSCTTCHARGETDSHHREERGYRYDSAACYSCHPNGKH